MSAAHIFLSYSREDQAVARHFAEGFERAGLSVWWDVTLEAGAAYDQVTEQALRDARAVVVLWSKKSVDSRWVRAEATTADRHGTLLPVMIEDCVRPIMFELRQTADLSRWNGNTSDVRWQTFLAGVHRFIERGASAAVDPSRVTAASRVEPASPPARNDAARRRLLPVLVALAVLVVAGGALWKFWPRGGAAAGAQAPAASAEPSIAVLPFVNMSSDKEQEYFADGLSEELLNQLAQLPRLRVIGRTSSFAFKGKNEDLRKIGESLGVNHILEGSVRRSGNNLRITAQLINPANGSHLWSETYDRELKNVFEIQDEIARAVSARLRLTLAGSGQKVVQTQNIAAYEAYLVGISKFRSGQPALIVDATKDLENATRLDPAFESAWAALYSVSSAVIAISPPDRDAALRRIESLVERARKLPPDSPYTTGPRLRVALQAKDYATALGIARAASANGSPVTGSSGVPDYDYGSLLLSLGEPTQAIAAFTDAIRKDPLVGQYSIMKMIAYEVSGQFALAEEQYRRTLTTPNLNLSTTDGSALVRAMAQRDRATLEQILPRVIASGPNQAAVNSVALANLDDAAAARRELRRLFADPRVTADMFSVAAISQWSGYFGDDALALEAWQRLSKSEIGFQIWGFTFWRPVNQGTRKLPGFKALLRDVGLVDYWRKTGQWGEFCKPVGADDFECR
jgi:TolB-like protein